MMNGFFITAFTNNEYNCILFMLAMYYPTLVLTGAMWPIQTSPGWVQFVGWFHPLTWPNEAARGILSRGWGMEHWRIQATFGVAAIYITAFLAGSLFFFNRHNK